MPGGAFDRYGILVALRDVDGDHHGLLCAGVLFEAAAARPTLALALHADVGVDLDARAPLVGGGLRTTLAIVGPLGVALDAGGELVIDGIDPRASRSRRPRCSSRAGDHDRVHSVSATLLAGSGVSLS